MLGEKVYSLITWFPLNSQDQPSDKQNRQFLCGEILRDLDSISDLKDAFAICSSIYEIQSITKDTFVRDEAGKEKLLKERNLHGFKTMILIKNWF